VPLDGEARLWLYGTARHVLANHDRGARRRDRLTERLRDELRRQLPVVQRTGEGSALLEALAELGEADRELLMLIGWEELTPTQAARALGISPLAARTRLHRARRRLRAQLAKQSSSNPPNTEIEVEEAR
jgi:RNA polymerase sigma-70 factor, ECF subfamily